VAANWKLHHPEDQHVKENAYWDHGVNKRSIRSSVMRQYFSSNPKWLTDWLATIDKGWQDEARLFASSSISNRLAIIWTNQKVSKKKSLRVKNVNKSIRTRPENEKPESKEYRPAKRPKISETSIHLDPTPQQNISIPLTNSPISNQPPFPRQNTSIAITIPVFSGTADDLADAEEYIEAIELSLALSAPSHIDSMRIHVFRSHLVPQSPAEAWYKVISMEVKRDWTRFTSVFVEQFKRVSPNDMIEVGVVQQRARSRQVSSREVSLQSRDDSTQESTEYDSDIEF
jgi:hypothetical protein